MGYFDLTIRSLDDIIDRLDKQRSALYQSNHKSEAGDLAEARGKVREVRDGLIAKQHDRDREAAR